MAAYRVVFHGDDDEPVAESTFEHPHDDAAIDAAGRHAHPHAIKVWQGGRLVAHFPSEGRPPRRRF